MSESPTSGAVDLEAIERARDQIRERHLKPAGERPASSARGLHHTALISSDVETTVRFYQDVLGFPLTELIDNRDYPGSSHFFFDIGNGNLLAFFDFPGLDVGPYAEVLGGLHHVAISVEPESLGAARAAARGGRRGARGAQRRLGLLPRPRRRPDRAHRRPARARCTATRCSDRASVAGVGAARVVLLALALLDGLALGSASHPAPSARRARRRAPGRARPSPPCSRRPSPATGPRSRRRKMSTSSVVISPGWATPTDSETLISSLRKVLDVLRAPLGLRDRVEAVGRATGPGWRRPSGTGRCGTSATGCSRSTSSPRGRR